MLFLKTIRMDDSDNRVFPAAAAPGEWAVVGTFAFLGDDPDELTGKRRQAFRNGFMGTNSFGWSTLVAVTTIGQAEYAAIVEQLADHLLASYGAPGRTQAISAAREEAEFAASLCEYPVGTMIAIERTVEDRQIAEAFRRINAQDDSAPSAWAIRNGSMD